MDSEWKTYCHKMIPICVVCGERACSTSEEVPLFWYARHIEKSPACKIPEANLTNT